MSSVLVTGTGGFVGSAIAARLVQDGYRVVGLFHDKTFGTFVERDDFVGVFGDVRDRDLLYRILTDYAVDLIVHQAGYPVVKKCEEDPWTAYSVNTMGTVAVLESARQSKREIRTILATTDKVYANGPVPYRELQPLEAKGPYSASKVAADVIARDYAGTYGLPVLVVRSSNIYGPGDRDETRLIPGNVLRLLRGEPAVLYTGALTMEREFVYIDDEVDAYLTLIEKAPFDGRAYNVGGAGPVSIVDVMRKLAVLCGGEVIIQPSGFAEISRQYMDASALNALGWSQKVSLDEGLKRTVEWFKSLRG